MLVKLRSEGLMRSKEVASFAKAVICAASCELVRGSCHNSQP